MNENKIKVLIEKLRNESLYVNKCNLEIMDLCMYAADVIENLYNNSIKECIKCKNVNNCESGGNINTCYVCNNDKYEFDFD